MDVRERRKKKRGESVRLPSRTSLCLCWPQQTKLDIAAVTSLFAKANPNRLDGRMRLLLADLGGRTTSEQDGGQINRTLTQLITWLTTLSPQQPRLWSDTHHIIAFAHSMRRCCLVTARTVGDTRIPVE
ncbi:hypothetical protein BLNAU_22459 [Blattamonas nauphoetae]|uniref:Uncharacterized protein n=1 Tax=Blattamonas nauphoetae TaxID=2049346 RepID=A0ABQ9WW36_9EUKA|nr:hypothetical protein BLNAU_22459 [Blattamonas nauphoetae]